MRRVIFPCLLILSACAGDETVTRYGAADKTWSLVELDGARFPERATLRFPQPGQVSGSGPCNAYQATMTAPYPWFELGEVASTRTTCPGLAAEQRFLAALQSVNQAEVVGDTMILSGSGAELVFKSGG